MKKRSPRAHRSSGRAPSAATVLVPLLLLALTLAPLTGCGTYVGADGSFSGMPEASADASFGFTSGDDLRELAEAENSATKSTRPGDQGRQQDLTGSPQRLLIRSGELTLDVSHPANAIARFTELVEAAGGYIQEQNNFQLRARVPAGRFLETFESCRQLGSVRVEKLKTLDVTEQHRDLEIRLTNASRARDRILSLLEIAQKVEDVLKLERELQRLTNEVERLTAQIEGLQLRIAMSLLDVTFHGPPELRRAPRQRPSRFPWINRVGPRPLLEGF